MRNYLSFLLGLAFAFPQSLMFAAGKAEHVVVVVWDGMRPDAISRKHTPTLHKLAREGVMFANHHSIFCTATDVNGAAIATGAYPANSGVIANNDFFPLINSNKPVKIATVAAIRKGDELTGGNFILRPTLAETLRAAGKSTAIAGTKMVALLHDRDERDEGCGHICIHEGGTTPPGAIASLTNVLGSFPRSVSGQTREARDEWTRRALIEGLWSNGVPDYSLLWLSEPDATQHATAPGSPLSIAAMESSDRQLAAVLAELDRRNLRDKTDVFVVSDHGFNTVSQFVDVAAQLRQAGFSARSEFTSPTTDGDVLVVPQSGAVLFFVTGRHAETTARLVRFLQQQEFSGAIFTREPLPGTFSLESAHLNRPNPPDIVMSMRWSADKNKFGVPGMFYGTGSSRTDAGSYGSHASLGRYDVHNTLVAAGPDFKRGFKNKLASANTDLAPTILWILGVPQQQPMDGRVLSEALTVKGPPVGKPVSKKLEATATNDNVVWYQYLKTTQVNDTIYLDEANGRHQKQK
ncbi:MAG TPA: alkaline phosphatase family protein [Verrucomicrobiota bacterium]|nr:alkaline phosphatase family protein [Verrucomicrobiota bacterium]